MHFDRTVINTPEDQRGRTEVARSTNETLLIVSHGTRTWMSPCSVLQRPEELSPFLIISKSYNVTNMSRKWDSVHTANGTVAGTEWTIASWRMACIFHLPLQLALGKEKELENSGLRVGNPKINTFWIEWLFLLTSPVEITEELIPLPNVAREQQQTWAHSKTNKQTLNLVWDVGGSVLTQSCWLLLFCNSSGHIINMYWASTLC